jgi:hypothetical protein
MFGVVAVERHVASGPWRVYNMTGRRRIGRIIARATSDTRDFTAPL